MREKVLKNRNTPPYGHSYFLTNLSKDKKKISTVVNTINSIAKRFGLNQRGSGITLSIYDKEIIKSHRDDIVILAALDLLTNFNLYFTKMIDIDTEQMSSGEYHLFASLIGIGALIKHSSLIFLDEPDISLHPNWQMQYISFLKKAFEKYSSCHFIIATHSHFLVSDMESATSKMIALTRDEQNNTKPLETIPNNTFAWSAEQILYEVFNTSSSRNLFVADKVGEILELMVEKDPNVSLIRERILELEKINLKELKEIDPLKLVIQKLREEFLSESQS